MKTFLGVLFGAVVGMTAAFLMAQDASREAAVARTKPAPVAVEVASKSPVIPSCRAIAIPAQPRERVACRTAKSLLQITGQARPLVVGGTNARVFSAGMVGSDVVARVRVRNETPAEQGVQAGGQELYLNVGGRRVDSYRLSAVRIPPASGRTVKLRFRLSMGEIAALREGGHRAELGVRPWHGSTVAENVVGVIRLRVRTATT